MQALFKEIVDGDIDAVRARIEKKPDSVALVATGQPKMYIGQSPLQVAYRNAEFDIAALLLEHGADPNFFEERSDGTSTLGHAVIAAVMRSRWLKSVRYVPGGGDEWGPANSVEMADASFAALVLLIEAGADARAVDSHGNTALVHATMTARQILPKVHYNDPDWVDPMPLNPELVDDLTRIFDTLIEHGADPDLPWRDADRSLADYHRAEPVAQFLVRR